MTQIVPLQVLPIFNLDDTIQLDHPILRDTLRRYRVEWKPKTRRAFFLGYLKLMGVAFILGLVVTLLSQQVEDAVAGIGSIAMMLLLASLFLGLVISSRAYDTALGAIQSEITASRMDLVRMSSISYIQYIHAKHVGVMIRHWQLTTRIAQFRVVMIAFIGGMLFFEWFGADRLPLNQPSHVGMVIYALIGMSLIVLTAFGVMLEAYVRLASASALGLGQSVRPKTDVGNYVVDQMKLISTYFAQGAVLVIGACMGISILPSIIYSSLAGRAPYYFEIILQGFTMLLLIIGLMCFIHYLVYSFGMTRAKRRLVMIDFLS